MCATLGVVDLFSATGLRDSDMPGSAIVECTESQSITHVDVLQHILVTCEFLYAHCSCTRQATRASAYTPELGCGIAVVFASCG
jgi:hypothetical protein